VLVDTVEALDGALRAAREGATTTVIVCPTAPERALLSAEAFWDLGAPEVAADELTRRLTAEHLARAEAQRRY
jgi:TPP-dependent trihydroxycyclohexane-1,2-dione (THcHDO) dehydratase